MAAGFCMLESGLVTTKVVDNRCKKDINLALSPNGILFVGYNLAYGISEGGYIGSFSMWSEGSKLETGYSDSSDWFFQTMFVCATVSIVSGAVAERIKFWPFFVFAV